MGLVQIIDFYSLLASAATIPFGHFAFHSLRDKGREGQWLAVAAARLKVEAGGCNAIFEKKMTCRNPAGKTTNIVYSLNFFEW
jgi:hypothetical protein